MAEPMSLKESCRSVAADMRAKRLVPGMDMYFDHEDQPCCVIGHHAHRMGLAFDHEGPATELAVEAAGMDGATMADLIDANDNESMVTVLTILDDIGGRDG